MGLSPASSHYCNSSLKEEKNFMKIIFVLDFSLLFSRFLPLPPPPPPLIVSGYKI